MKFLWKNSVLKVHSHLPQRAANFEVDLRQHRDMKFSISAETQLSTAVLSRKCMYCEWALAMDTINFWLNGKNNPSLSRNISSKIIAFNWSKSLEKISNRNSKLIPWEISQNLASHVQAQFQFVASQTFLGRNKHRESAKRLIFLVK